MHEDGYVTEGTSSTSYIITDGRIVTRPLSNVVLSGVTRRSVLWLSAESGMELEERPFTLEEAYCAEEAFLSDSSSLIMPVVTVDGRTIGIGQPGALTRRLRELYIELAMANH